MGFRDDVIALRNAVRPAGQAASDRIIEYAQLYHQRLRDEMADELVRAGDTTADRWRNHRWYAELELSDEEIAGDIEARR